MSSHHIVKEDQEPALFILSGEALSFEKIQELLEWSPTIIVAEWEVPKVKAWGIKLDVVLCAEANLERLKEELADQAPIKFITFHSTEDSPLYRPVLFAGREISGRKSPGIFYGCSSFSFQPSRHRDGRIY